MGAFFDQWIRTLWQARALLFFSGELRFPTALGA
jgi:hypothetical protein